MRLNQIRLEHYRNYEHLELDTSGNINLLIGENAQGKTNLLESIFVMALTKSHRTSKDRELIAWDQKQARLIASIEKKYGPCTLDLSISQLGKRAKVNGLEQRKLSNFIGLLNVVMFAPEDLEIVKGAPGIRRRFMDMEMGQVQPGYVHLLSQYQKVLQQRNHLLKSLFSQNNEKQMALLDVWDSQLAEFGSKIMKKRQSFINRLQKWAETIHFGITKGQEQLVINYRPSFETEEFTDETVLMEQFMIKLSQVKKQELRRGTTLLGPHRDDLDFTINERAVQSFGSQGQQRTTALSVKLAEIELIHEETGDYPILLLDDVLSELDRFRQTHLIATFQRKVQTFITATGIDSINMEQLDEAAIFRVDQSRITKE